MLRKTRFNLTEKAAFNLPNNKRYHPINSCSIILKTIIMWSIACLIPLEFSSFVPSSLWEYGKSPSPFGEGLNFQPNHLYTAYRSAVNFQPDHLYTTYRSVVNFLCTNKLPSTKRKVNRTIH